jgi:acyl dehydratase
MMRDTPLGPYRVEACNTSRGSDNKIHDDAVARGFGFAGGLVPGVDVYGYMTHLPVARWGRDWLERGTAECRFLKPVYDGDLVEVSASETADGIELRAESRGALCATGRAALAATAPPAAEESAAPPPPAVRPAADEATLAIGTRLSIRPVRVGDAESRQYLRDLRETLPLYAAERLVHPAVVAGLGNWALKDNVVLGPWMHVGSRIEHFSAARVEDELTAEARVTANYENKGHRFVDLDVVVYANRTRPVARLAHLSIYRLRQPGI